MVTVVADNGRFTDDDTHAVVDKEPLADRRAGVNLDPGQKSSQVRNQAGRQVQSSFAERRRKPMDNQCVQARIGKCNLDGGSGRWIALLDG